MGTLTDLAREALLKAELLDTFTTSKGLPLDSLDNYNHAAAQLQEVEAIRNSLADSCQQMRRLALGPEEVMMDILYSFADILSVKAIYEYDLASHVPLNGTISYSDIAKASSLSESLCRRFLVHAMENGIFAEESGNVQHSDISRRLATDKEFLAAVGLVVSELAPASHRVVEAIRKWPESFEPTETGFNIENHTELPFYGFLAQNRERMSRFSTAMQFFSRSGGIDLKHLLNGYPWKSIDHPGTIVVDVGGGQGTVSKAIAAKTKHINFLVQDLAGPVKIGRQMLPPDLIGRVKYAEADFFADQQLIGAHVYFFRWILHNWSDGYCVKILRSLVPAMRSDSKVIIYEYVLEEGPQQTRQAKLQRDLDMVMLTVWNACERTAKDWEKLFELADKRFVFKGTTLPQGSIMSIVEVGWRGEDIAY